MGRIVNKVWVGGCLETSMPVSGLHVLFYNNKVCRVSEKKYRFYI